MNKLDYILGIRDSLFVVNAMLDDLNLTIKTSEFYKQYYMLLQEGCDDLALCEPEIETMRKRTKELEIKTKKKRKLQ